MSTEHSSAHTTSAPRPGWNQPRPEKLPEPTAWPAGVALAVTFILWGFVSSFIVSAVGVALFIAAMVGWVKEIRHERKQP
jgi:hypothetical protein